MRTLLLIAALVLNIAILKGQNTAKVAGKVISTAENINATITLLNAKDSSAVKAVVAAKNGAFAFDNITDGKYLVSIVAVEHAKQFSKIFEINPSTNNVHLGEIVLNPIAKSMTGVTVTSKRPLIENKIDRTVVNVDASITNIGTTAMEVLEKSPGVSVDKEGNISIKGKDGVMVLVDGRPTQLGGTDLANYLRGMSSNQLDQIEIMTNPPAKYDAAGNAGIINIKTKKSKTVGYNGGATVGFSMGRYPKTNEAFNFNYREGKVNVFANLSHNYNKNFETLTIQRNIREEGTNTLENYFDQEANMIRKGNAGNVKLGLDYFANKNTSFGVVVGGFKSKGIGENDAYSNIFSPTKELQTITNATVATNNSFKNFNTNLNFRTILDGKGKELTADVDYVTFSSVTDQYLINTYYNNSNANLTYADSLQGSLPQNITVYSGRVDYLQPLKKGARFEAGIKSSIVETDNNASYDSIKNGSAVYDTKRSNHFIYQENVNAAYVNLSTPLTKKLSVQAGLRYENTIAKGNQLITKQKFDREYHQLFPTVFFQYKANDKNNFGINYGRRILRPNYEKLNPFIRFIDRYTFSQGNPDLKPQISNNIELAHTYKNIITTTLNYSITNDIMQNVIEQKGQEAYSTPANIASLKQFGIAISANHPVTKWWTSSINVNAFKNHYKGVVNKASISFTQPSIMISGNQQFKLSKTLGAELNGGFRSATVQGVIRTKPIAFLSAGFSQQVLKTKGTVRLSVRDIFYTQKSRAVTKYGNVDANFQEVRDSRVVNIGFSYRFSKGKMGAQKKKTTGSASDEQSRIGID